MAFTTQELENIAAATLDFYIKDKPFAQTIQEKPLIASVCQLNDGKTMQDAMEFVPKMTKLMNKTTGANVASSISGNWSIFAPNH